MQVDKRPEPEPLAPQESGLSSSVLSSTKRIHPAILVVGAFVVLLGALWFIVYQLPMTNGLNRAVASVVPFPAARVNNEFVTMPEFVKEYEALQTYLSTSEETASMPKSEVIVQTILDSLINKLAIAQLAKQQGVTLDEARVEQFYQEALQTTESEEVFLQELKDTFGWTQEEFKDRIVRSIVLALQMSEVTLKDESLQGPVRVQIEEEFATPGTLTEEDYGFVPVESLPQGWESVAELPVGERSGVIDTETEYAIVTVTERSTVDESETIHLVGVILPKVTLEDVVKQYLATANVHYYLN